MTWMLALIPNIAMAYVLIIQPVADRILPGVLNTQIIWPLLFGVTMALAIACRRDLDFGVLRRPPGLLLIAFLCYAAASNLWALSQPDAAKRWIQAVILVAVILVPFAVKQRKVDILAGVYWTFVAAITIHAGFVLTTAPQLDWTGNVHGHAGYFLHKQYLGMQASCAFLLGLYSLVIGKRRVVSLVLIVASVWLVFSSGSKTALGFAVITPIIAMFVMVGSRSLKVPIAVLVAAIPVTYISLSLVISNLSNRLAFRIYGDATFTGRTVIWDFIETQTALKPWFGWGFRSFWFVPFSPIYYAPGFVSSMPSSHSGYLDLRLENGYVGLAIFLAFIVSVLYALEHVRRVNPRLAFAMLSLFVYVMAMNLMETIWFIHFDPLWILFLVLVGEAMRHAAATGTAPQPIAKPSRVHFFSHSRVVAHGQRPIGGGAPQGGQFQS